MNGVLAHLYRWRWWIIVAISLIAVFVGDRQRPVVWVLGLVTIGLVWIPVAIRWAQAGRAAGPAFREGLHDR